MSAETELIKERLDLAEVVGEYVHLKRVGGHFKGLCPFHSEKTPSFIVSPDKGIWHCFGCQKGGDVFSFVQDVEGMDFPTALKMLAERAGVTLQASPAARHDPRARQFELHSVAARFYHELLLNQSVGLKAKEYLEQRGVTAATCAVFEIGYAPQRWDSLQLYLQRKGFSDREMIDSGLVGRNTSGKPYDRFRGRIMFPIHDIQGRVVGFGGRIAPWHATGEEGKYINSPETAIYSKRKVVYNLNRAKRSLHQQPCIVVEGYMDVVMLVQSGITNVVASSGTAFTAEQVALLARYTQTLHFAFDGDAAGVQAAEAATAEASRAGMRVATILFPEGRDPADVAQADLDQLRAALAAPIPLVQVLLQRLQETEGGVGREAMLERVLPLVQQTTNTVQQGEMIQTIATTLHVPEAVVVSRLVAVREPVAPLAPPLAGPMGGQVGLSSDQLLLGLLVADPSVRAVIADEVKDEFFSSVPAQELWQALQGLRQAGDWFSHSADQVVGALPEDVASYAEALRRVSEEYLAHISTTPVAEAKVLVRSLKKEAASAKLRVLRDRLSSLSGDERAAALQEFQIILKELSTRV